jgi:hypothetical protein
MSISQGSHTTVLVPGDEKPGEVMVEPQEWDIVPIEEARDLAVPSL